MTTTPHEKTPWDEVKREYLSGIQPRILCSKYNLNYKSLTNRITREGWKRTRKEIIEKIGEKVGDLEAIAIQQMREKEREHTDIIVKAILNKLIYQDKINPELSSQDVKSLSGAYKDIQQIKYKSFGIKENEDEKQSITINIDGIDAKL